ncbi:RES family NAD+ phosphorylase [Facilibium subflavum]|uniref:RES family NAD+ phosphorylase n=1 Tax=Facilibium subflavum TaxID=2219058 RepID=UPI0013C2BB7C|nr:RES family NAD+ phosphorylase [Facilibium subflavum]
MGEFDFIKKHIQLCERLTVYRSIETQNNASTLKLTEGNVQEQERLEQLLEEKAKPQTEYTNYHYLIYTPFRYPPLKHGSRFGSMYEKSLWYGSTNKETALAESAFYLFNFNRQANIENTLYFERTVFSIQCNINKFLDLTKIRKLNQKRLTSKGNYAYPQKLSKAMREIDIEAFLYESARNAGNKNFAAYTPEVFKKNTLKVMPAYIGVFTPKEITYKSTIYHDEVFSYPIESFFHDNTLPNIPK